MIRRAKTWKGTFAALLALALLAAAPARAAVHALVVSGLGGDPEYDHRFAEWNATLTGALRKLAGDPARVRSLSGRAATAEALEKTLATMAGEITVDDTAIVVLLGHGSYAGDEYRLNLPGPDPTGAQIAALLNRLPARRQLVVNATSASGAVAEAWKKPGRVVITATRSGGERNATRFASHFIDAISTDRADRDKDQRVTAQEAFAYVTQAVAEAFKADAAIATEHARLEGADAQSIVLARFGAAARFVDDARLEELQRQQSSLEQELAAYRARKPSMTEDDYYAGLEPLLVRIARLGLEQEARENELGIQQPQEASDATGATP